MAKKISEKKALYMKQRKRIQSFIKRAEKRGYSFPSGILPPIPKNITQASINRLAKLTPEKLYSKATAQVKTYDKTGQALYKEVSGTQARLQERQEAGRRGYQARVLAIQEGYETVQEYRDNDPSAPLSRSAEAKARAKRQGDRRYRESIKKWLTDEDAQAFGFENVDVMIDSPSGAQIIEGLQKLRRNQKAREKQQKEKEAKEQAEKEAAEELENSGVIESAESIEEAEPPTESAAPTEAETPGYKTPTGYTQDDIDFMNSPEFKAHEATHGVVNEGDLILDQINSLINFYDTPGKKYLENLLNYEMEIYGRDKVLSALAMLEDNDPDLIAEMQNLIFYQEHGTSNHAHRAFKSLAQAIHSVGEGYHTGTEENKMEFARALGDAMSAMEVYEDVQ